MVTYMKQLYNLKDTIIQLYNLLEFSFYDFLLQIQYVVLIYQSSTYFELYNLFLKNCLVSMLYAFELFY